MSAPPPWRAKLDRLVKTAKKAPKKPKVRLPVSSALKPKVKRNA